MERKPTQPPTGKIDVFDAEDAITRADGNPSALNVLTSLKLRGDDVYNRVAPHLGTGEDIAIKYQIECEFDLDKLIKKYGK